MAVASGFVAGNGALAHSPVIFYYILFFSAGAFILYQIDRAVLISPEDGVNVPEREVWFRDHRVYVVISVSFSSTIACVAALGLPLSVVVLGAFVGLAGIMHALPEIGGRRRLKSFGILKSTSIAGAWIVGGVVIPIVYVSAGNTISSSVIWLLAFYRIPILFSNLLVADFLDRRGDNDFGLRSLGFQLPWQTIRILSILLLLVSAVVGLSGAQFMDIFKTGYSLLFVDLVGHVLIGTVICWKGSIGRERLILLDLLVGWPAVTFCASFLLS